MNDYTELTRRLATLAPPHQAMHGAFCALRYTPVLTTLAPGLDDTAARYTDLLIGNVGEVDDERLAAAVDETEELIPECGDAASPDYWIMNAFSLVVYALETAWASGSEEAPDWACGEALNLAANIDYSIHIRGLPKRLERLEVAAQASSIRQLDGDITASTIAGLRSEAAAFRAELTEVLPVFLRSLRT